MITFIIPLMSSKAARNWDVVTKLFNRTLWSVYNQTNSEFRVIVVCHEKPVLTKNYDDRVEFICLTEKEAPIPVTQHEKMIDKGIKTHYGAIRARELGGGYIMLVDADDLISNKIAQFVVDHPDENGFFIRTGYVYFDGDNFFQTMHKFPSSTSNIVNYKIEDLPSTIPLNFLDNCDSNPWIIRKHHRSVPKVCKELGRPLKKLPFKGAVYVQGSGENHSMAGKKHKFQTPLRRFVQFFERKYRLNGKLKDEFSVDWI